MVVLVERRARDAAQQARVRHVRVRQRGRQRVQRGLARRARGHARGLRVALSAGELRKLFCVGQRLKNVVKQVAVQRNRAKPNKTA